MNTPTSAHAIWQGFHWTFFVNVQGLVLSLLRFQLALDGGQIDDARLELGSAAMMLRASGAAMELAGSFSRLAYQDEVRPSMTPPLVISDKFSGLMSWDHARLVRLWQQLKPHFQDLPPALAPEHAAFVNAFGTMMSAHKGVCSRFGGDAGGSLRAPDGQAIDTLERIEKNRRDMIDPGGRVGCPFAAAREQAR